MLNKIKTHFEKKAFDAAAATVRNTPPIRRKDGPLSFVSLMCHRDIDSYLVAIKSVYRAFGEGDITLVNDGSLTPEDITLLEHHLGPLDVIPIADVDTGACPRGGCWERLATLVRKSADRYAIQVDADLVAIGSMQEAVEAYRANKPFTLGNKQRPGRVTFSEMSKWIAQSGFGHYDTVQVVGENLLEDMPDADQRYYVRASAAFTGFPKSGVSYDQVERFSTDMEALLGARWQEWGTEQFASNAMVAAAGETVELVPPTYVNNMPSLDVSQADMIHFFGTHRYTSNRYRTAVKQALRALS